jgi:hypothetical protein
MSLLWLSGENSLRVCIPFSIRQTLEIIMKKNKSSDLKSVHEKQYDATLLTIKLLASIIVEIKSLSSEIKQQNSLLKDFIAGKPLEEESV